MKNAITLILLAVVVATQAIAGNVKLTGKITNKLSDSIYVIYNTQRIGYEQKVVGEKLKADGSFELTVPVVENYTFLMLQHGGQETELVMPEGAKWNLTLDGQRFDSSLRYTGKGSEVGNFVAAHLMAIGSTNEYGREAQQHFLEEPAAFETWANGEWQKEKTFTAANGKGLPAEFLKTWNGNYQYKHYYLLLMYPQFHEMMKQQSYNVTVPKANYVVSQKVPKAFDDDMVGLQSYTSYLMQYYQTKVNELGITDDSTHQFRTHDTAIHMAMKELPKKSAELVLATRILMEMKYFPYEHLEQDYARLNKAYPKHGYQTVLEAALADKKKMLPGQPALDFEITTVDGQKTKLSALKGKVVMLDFWASWCGPCIREMPFAKKVKEHFKGRDVVFLYVSIDEDEQNWKTAMQKQQIEGMHMLSPGGWQAPVAQLYSVNSIPAYFLIDKNGNFAVAQTPRPSNTQALIAAIEQLLK